ncbi:MAG: DUF2478 domain-containing protein [Alphaproteobacteria bacterium]|nr:DUF2478 domain-containing protein [Alphaproteobacteria bacterium]
MSPDLPIGVILHERGGATEELLADFARSLRRDGVDVGGLIQCGGHWPNGRERMELVDLREGTMWVISQDLGSGSASCRLDPVGLAAASAVLRREIAAQVALLVVNKFAGSEAEGEGLAPEMFEAASLGIPLLTALSQRYKPRWDALTGGAGRMLEPTEQALRGWWAEIAERTLR